MKNNLLIEIRRAIHDFMIRMDVLASHGELNSDGAKALFRILRMMKESGMKSEASRLLRSMKKRDMEDIAIVLREIEERLS